ncbi:MAG: helix-turn-helix transcriptional regulator [Candidatus Methanomethylicaceae archaeon]
MRSVSLMFLAIAIMVLTTPLTMAQSIQESSVIIYRDGFVHVKMSVSVNETLASITLPLLSYNFSNVLVYDENGEPLNYEVTVLDGAKEASIQIYSLGATLVRLEYDTASLTSKLGSLWTFAVNAPFELSVFLPENSTIMYLNVAPKLITIDGQRIKIVFYPGYCEVSYEIGPQVQPPVSEGQPVIWYVLVAAVIPIIIILTVYSMRRKKVIKELKEDEKRIIEFIKKNGNRALEAELRGAFPSIPRTTMWRLLKSLEKRGIIRIKRVGLQNLVELI